MANSFVYFDDAVVSRENNLYKVVLWEEDTTVFLREHLVEEVVKQTQIDDNLIAILIAYVEYVRKDWSEGNKFRSYRIEEKNIIEGLCVLLSTISIDELISIVRSMKWYQIVTVLSSESPLEEIEKL